MVIRMSDFGTSLVTRVSGRRAYDAIVSSTNNLAERVTFDFDGVETTDQLICRRGLRANRP